MYMETSVTVTHENFGKYRKSIDTLITYYYLFRIKARSYLHSVKEDKRTREKLFLLRLLLCYLKFPGNYNTVVSVQASFSQA